MKKFLLSIAVASAWLFASAADFTAMTFTTTGGVRQTISVQGLEITLSATSLSATSATGSIEIPLTDLVAMEFSNEETSGVAGVMTDAAGTPFTVWSVDGRKVGSFQSADTMLGSLPEGVYIMRGASGTTVKFMIRK